MSVMDSLLAFTFAATLLTLTPGLDTALILRTATVEGRKMKSQNWFIKGMFGNVLNPKVGIFYVSFLPQFIPHGQPLIAWTFGLVFIHLLLGTCWSTLLISATRPLSSFLRKEKVIRWMDRCTGMVFLLFATRLALSKR